VKFLVQIASAGIFCLLVFNFSSCKKNKFVTDPESRVRFSQDSVLFDTVFTKIGSATRNFRVINNNNQKIKISSVELLGGNASPFIINVDGSPGRSFTDLEIAANDSMYIFVQVKVDPANQNSPLIINDAIRFIVNGHTQTVYLEAWGQDAYYHYPTDAIKFKDGSYLAYSTISTQTPVTVTWPNDKPHVIYGYLVVDSKQKLIINAGTRIYMNYKAGLWVYQYGEIKINGQKGNEVIIQGARREKEYADEPGQWDRIWINEGSYNNEINYAIIKNGYIGIQTEVFGDTIGLGRLKLTNTKIQNMSKWGIYSLAYDIYGGNNVISNCQEHCLNILLGGNYTFLHCTFVNQWEKENARDKPSININNYYESSVYHLDSCYFGNCIIDGKMGNEINLDVKGSGTITPNYIFSSSWLKTTNGTGDVNHYINVRTSSDSQLDYESPGTYYFQPKVSETRVKGFVHVKATQDATRFPFDLNAVSRNTASIMAGAYENN
jgi:hypothetical protein